MTAPFDIQEGGGNNFTDEPIDEMGRTARMAEEEFKYPKAILNLSKERAQELRVWLSDQLTQLTDEYETKREEWARYEHAYKAHPEAPKQRPFIGASTDNIPLIASMVDPVHARLETGVLRQNPPFRLSASEVHDAVPEAPREIHQLLHEERD